MVTPRGKKKPARKTYGYGSRSRKQGRPLAAMEGPKSTEEYQLERDANELLEQARHPELRNHTPAEWLPRNQRPGYVSDPKAERRRIV